MNLEKLALEKDNGILTDNINNYLKVVTIKEKNNFLVSAIKEGIVQENHYFINTVILCAEKDTLKNTLLNKVGDLSLNEIFIISFQTLFNEEKFLESFEFILKNAYLKQMLIDYEKEDNALLHSLCLNNMVDVLDIYLNNNSMVKNINKSKKSLRNLFVTILDKNHFDIADQLLNNKDIFDNVDINELPYLLVAVLEHNEKNKTQIFNYLIYDKNLKTITKELLEKQYIDYLENEQGFVLSGQFAEKYIKQTLDNSKSDIEEIIKIFEKRDLNLELNRNLPNNKEIKHTYKL